MADRTFIVGWSGRGTVSDTHRTFAVPIVSYSINPQIVTADTGGTLTIQNGPTFPGASSGVAYDENIVLTGATGTTMVIIKDGPPAPNLLSLQPSLNRLTGTPL